MTPPHRARIWKSGCRWLARRPKLTATAIQIERADFATYDEARRWACKRPATPGSFGVSLSDATQAMTVALAWGFRRTRSDFTLTQ